MLRFDSLGGASGDMILGALADAGANMDSVRAGLQGLPIETFSISTEECRDAGMRCTRVSVDVPDVHHPHRKLPDIRSMIADSELPERARTMAIAVFERLAAAEGAVHGMSPESIHFHEVGAMDAIVDVVGACLALLDLRVDCVSIGPLPVGRGTVRGSHGVMPLPVPAVAELLKNHPLDQTEENCELVTPTGAALLMTWAAIFPPPHSLPPMTLLRSGSGAGHRKLAHRPNILRALLLDDSAGQPATHESCIALECNLDDANPQQLGTLFDRLLEAGALDVFVTPVTMKKQRPGTLLTVLCASETRQRCIDLVFSETPTFGIREHSFSRTVLARRHETVETAFGPVRIKVGSLDGRDITFSPEYEDCLLLANSRAVALRLVQEAAVAAAYANLREPPATQRS